MIMLKADTEDHILELKTNQPTHQTHTQKTNPKQNKTTKNKYIKGILKGGYSVLLMSAWVLIISTLH